jgi:hypothetical protein
MSFEQFDDNCPGCKPAILDLQTGRPLPADHPSMIKITAIWETTSRVQRQAFHRVMCLNSRDPVDLLIVKCIADRFQAKPNE